MKISWKTIQTTIDMIVLTSVIITIFTIGIILYYLYHALKSYFGFGG